MAASDSGPSNGVPKPIADAFYIAVGAAVIGFQKLAVLRREVEVQVEKVVHTIRGSDKGSE